MQASLPKNFAFVDIETTGYSNKNDRIIEIAVLKVEDGELVETFQTLLNPNQYLSDFIENYTGITSAELETAPSFENIAGKLLALLEGSVFVAHNVNFDYGFLKNEFLRCGYDFNLDRLCTVRLSRNLYPHLKKYNLTNIINMFGFDCPNRHRAFDDAHVLWQLYKKAISDFGVDGLACHIVKSIKNSKIPNMLDESIVESLPEKPGVYIFYGDNDLPLYIGKSVNIKKRVKSHFTGNITVREQSLHEQTRNILYHVTAGELSALLLEARLIKEQLPIFNSKLRRKTEMVFLKSKQNSEGYYTLSFERTKKMVTVDGEKIVGSFDSIRDCKDALLRAADEHNLCCKLLGVENAMNACFRYHLGKCKGACVGKESASEYNERFLNAFNASSDFIEVWPFEGPIRISEFSSSGDTDGHSEYIVDKWCLVNEKSASVELYSNDFDRDIYRIIKGYINKPRENVDITVI